METLTILHPGNGNGRISETHKLQYNTISVNGLRKVIQACSRVYQIDETMEEIQLQISDGRKIYYKDIQTKRGLSKKMISIDELFRRGGKIFD